MVFEAHCMPCPCTELLLLNFAKVNTVFYGTFKKKEKNILKKIFLNTKYS